jgi:tRNA threonylcarbamoyladenosine biosynthesis protein TsaB
VITLAIDTSSAVGSVAIVKDGEAISEKRLTSLPGHSESLLITIRQMLDHAGLTTRDICLLAAGNGPGSFTGLRVGLATMKGLHLSTGAPLLAAPSLLALAMNLDVSSNPPPFVCAAIDARRGDVFAAVYRFEGGGATKVIEEKMARPDGVIADLSALGTEVLCLGDAFIPPARGEAVPLLGATGRMIVPAEGSLHFPSAVNVARIAGRRLAGGEIDDAASIEPRYVRPVDFKIKG